MISNIEKKKFAIKLRKAGKSYTVIEKELGIPKSTLSGWVSSIKLTQKQTDKLFTNKIKSLVKARSIASEIHRKGRTDRIKRINLDAESVINALDITKIVGELIFATFYQAEGAKKENAIVIANSNPKTIKGIIELFRHLYDLDERKFRCRLHLRSDQSDLELKDFWSKQVSISQDQFTKTQFDKRAVNRTYIDYMGVCVVTYFDINLQRRILLYIGEKLINKLTDMGGFQR